MIFLVQWLFHCFVMCLCCPPAASGVFHAPIARYSLFVLKVLLNTNKLTKPALKRQCCCVLTCLLYVDRLRTWRRSLHPPRRTTQTVKSTQPTIRARCAPKTSYVSLRSYDRKLNAVTGCQNSNFDSKLKAFEFRAAAQFESHRDISQSTTWSTVTRFSEYFTFKTRTLWLISHHFISLRLMIVCIVL